MNIKEVAQALKLKMQDPDDGRFDIGEFAEALISAYKAELLKEVGEPVGTFWYEVEDDGYQHEWGISVRTEAKIEDGDKLFTFDQVAAAILKATKPLEEEIDRLESESEEYAQLQSRCFDGGGSHASVFDEVSELRAQLAAAQEEVSEWRGKHDVACLTITKLQKQYENQLATTAKAMGAEEELLIVKDQLAKAEQRVAEACALQVATETRFHWLDAARVAKEIRSGEYRKFVKEV
jgi:phosphoglycolate phosphatase-like HAD superfamily hydrolase